MHAHFYFLLDMKDELNDAMGVPFFYGLVEGLFIGMNPRIAIPSFDNLHNDQSGRKLTCWISLVCCKASTASWHGRVGGRKHQKVSWRCVSSLLVL